MLKILGIISSLFFGGIALNSQNNLNVPEPPKIVNTTITNNNFSPSVKIDYTSKILDKNILYVTGFEDGDMPYSYKYNEFPLGHNREFGGQSKTMEEKSEGTYSTKITDSYSNGNYDRGFDINGNHLGYEPYSILRYKERLYLPDNVYVSVTADVKSSEPTIFSSAGIGGKIDKPTSWGGRRFIKDAKIGDTVIYATNIDQKLKDVVSNGEKIYIASNDTQTGNYSYGVITSVDIENSSISISDPLRQDFNKGDFVLAHTHVNPILFPKITLNKTLEWTSVQSNALVDSSKYTTSKRGIEYWWKTETAGTAYVDNIRFGYANKIKILKNNETVYEGYDLSYTDSNNPDISSPNKIENIQGIITLNENGKTSLKVNFDKPEDIATEYKYNIVASYDGVYSKPSEDIILNSLSGIKGYSFIIDQEEITIPDNSVDINDTQINQDIDFTDNDNLYIHIKAIDNAGNSSETSHYKIQKQQTNLESKYDKSKQGVTLEWTFTDSNTDNYYFNIYRKENKGDFKLIKERYKDTRFTDLEAMDINSPKKPSIKNQIYNSDTNSFIINMNKGEDIGTIYEYRVDVLLLNGDKVSSSNIENIEIKADFKEFLYKVDINNSLIGENAQNGFNEVLDIPMSKTENYVHIQAIDNNNQYSEALSLKISDDISPTIDLRLTNYSPTNKSVSIICTAKDNTAIDYIILPNGSKIKSNSFSYEVFSNGIYSFFASDISGNITTKSIKVSNIDKSKPTVEITKNPNNSWNNTDVDIEITSRK